MCSGASRLQELLRSPFQQFLSRRAEKKLRSQETLKIRKARKKIALTKNRTARFFWSTSAQNGGYQGGRWLTELLIDKQTGSVQVVNRMDMRRGKWRLRYLGVLPPTHHSYRLNLFITKY